MKMNAHKYLLILIFISTAPFAAEVEIYTTSFCGECLKAKAYLREKSVVFEERDVEKNLEWRRDFYARGGKGVPYLFVRGQAMHGFDAERFEKLRGERTERGG